MSLEIDTSTTRVAWLINEQREQPSSDDETIFGDTEASDTSNTSNTSNTSSTGSSGSATSNSNINQTIVPYNPPSISLNNPAFGIDMNSCVVPINGFIPNFDNTYSSYDSNPDLDCPICFDLLSDSEIIKMDCCGKKIHLKCINEWYTKNHEMQTRSLCIMCRVESELMNDIYNSLQIEESNSDDETSNDTSTDDNDKCTCKKITLSFVSGFFVFIIMILFFNIHFSSHQGRNLTDTSMQTP